MSFQIPDYLKRYINETKYRKPFENFIDNSTYYTQLNWQWQNYMQNVVRPCIAYSLGATDGGSGNALSTAAGMAITKGAARLISGDKTMFLGEDLPSRFLSDIWSPATNFNKTKARAIEFMLQGGTSVLKWNKTSAGLNTLNAVRIDRTLFSTDDNGDIIGIVFFISLFSDMTDKATSAETVYWLVEERKYNESGEKVIKYKVFSKSGTEDAPILPDAELDGVQYEQLPLRVQRELKKKGITALNEELPLEARDGLGVWLLSRTASNSCIPESPMGDPLLYGCLDVLWSIDIVFSGMLVDVLNGEGKIICPKQFLQATLASLQAQNPGMKFNVTTSEIGSYGDDSFVYIMPSGFEKEKSAPLPVQFDIRAEQYGRMLEIYERLAAVRAGYSPTSIFPYLTPDNSAKTATEVTAEENLTRASVRDSHNIIMPVFSRAVREILFQEGYESESVQVQFGDYIGNKLQYDENIRQNYTSGLIPKETAVKLINNLTERETQEYLQKIKADDEEKAKRESAGVFEFNDKDYFGDEVNDGSAGKAEQIGVGDRRSAE